MPLTNWLTEVIALQKNNKLIYLSTYGAPKYECFYECELLTDGDEVYLFKGAGNVKLKKLLEVISEFFEIERVK